LLAIREEGGEEGREREREDNAQRGRKKKYSTRWLGYDGKTGRWLLYSFENNAVRREYELREKVSWVEELGNW
jgi:hypothetical protein